MVIIRSNDCQYCLNSQRVSVLQEDVSQRGLKFIFYKKFPKLGVAFIGCLRHTIIYSRSSTDTRKRGTQ